MVSSEIGSPAHQEFIRTLVINGKGPELRKMILTEERRLEQIREEQLMKLVDFLSSKAGCINRLSIKTRRALARILADNLQEVTRIIHEVEFAAQTEDGSDED